ncbi:hypothetical protein OnM2_037066 [Erysiphe neolycopersici]|uniref:5'-3' DNA helicase ZGRF1-like N-terminal domain-containing protein n=1 Tax=Erysiphe neolycopersici TaxID=212602 RepID=A0A420HX25_9PEZI|nr:hypothetical protein OnM2_037066 [Erysiphe neolycopersici]
MERVDTHESRHALQASIIYKLGNVAISARFPGSFLRSLPNWRFIDFMYFRTRRDAISVSYFNLLLRMTSYPTSSKLATKSNCSPQFQKTAPVLDFRCLFTRDVQRKQKRWQDGRLKFHTFNKRIMVHDEGSNFVGDSYWQNGDHLEEGEELSLQQHGIIVQVGEYMGKRDQDLDELVDKRLRIREERAIAKLISRSISDPAKAIENQCNEYNQRYPKSLNTVIPNGQIKNKSIPKRSPSDGKRLHENDLAKGLNGCELSTKRQKRNFSQSSKSTYAQNLMGAKVILTSKIDPSSKMSSYKPVKIGFNSPNSSHITIDLTKDDKSSPLKRRHKEIKKPRHNCPMSAQNFAPMIHESNSSFTSRLTRAVSIIPDPIHTSKNSMNSDSSITRENSSIKNPESYNPLTRIRKKLPADEEKQNNSTSLLPTPHHILEKEDGSFSSSKNSSEISTSRNFEKQYDIQPRTVTKYLKSLSGQSSSPTVSEVTIDLENSDIECNSTLSDNSFAGCVINQPKNTLRLKTRPRRKMMFMEGLVDSGIICNQDEYTQHKLLKPEIKIKKKEKARISSCKTQNTEVLSTSGVLTSPQNKQKDSINSYQSIIINDYTEDLELRDKMSRKVSPYLTSNSKVPNESRLKSRNSQSTNAQPVTSERFTDHNNYKGSRLMHNNETKKIKKSVRNVLEVEKKRGNLKKNLQGPEKTSLDKNHQLSKLTSIIITPKSNFLYTEDKTSYQEVTGATTTASNVEAIKSIPKTMLLNPATRGIPLHAITASTVDALNIIGDITSPSLPSLSGMEESFGGCGPLNIFPLENISSSLGPWSRESFDLFGITKPP